MQTDRIFVITGAQKTRQNTISARPPYGAALNHHIGYSPCSCWRRCLLRVDCERASALLPRRLEAPVEAPAAALDPQGFRAIAFRAIALLLLPLWVFFSARNAACLASELCVGPKALRGTRRDRGGDAREPLGSRADASKASKEDGSESLRSESLPVESSNQAGGTVDVVPCQKNAK